jgi:hypothetical protein
MAVKTFGAQADSRFIVALGLFHATWTSIDLTLDCALRRFLNITPEHMLLLTAGMELGRKIRLLIGLVQRSDDKHKAQIVGALNKLQNDAKRAAFAHSYLIDEGDGVTFLERQSGEYKIRRHHFSVDEFVAHVTTFGTNGAALWSALGYTDADLREIVASALQQVPR